MGPPGVSCRWSWSLSCSDAAKSSESQAHVKQGLTVVEIGMLLERQGVEFRFNV